MKWQVTDDLRRTLTMSFAQISWFRPNSSANHLKFIAIGDILFPEYSTMSRFNLISSSSAVSRLLISNVLIEDHGLYTCKSSSAGQHSIQLLVHCMSPQRLDRLVSDRFRILARPFLTPSSPLLLYPVNRTFSITCSLLCAFEQIDLTRLHWLVDGELLNEEKNDYLLETLSSHTQRLTVYLNHRNRNFAQANYTCEYDGKEATTLVRRRTSESNRAIPSYQCFAVFLVSEDEMHRLPRQEGSSAAYLLQTVFDTGQRPSRSLSMLMFFLLLLWFP